MALEIIGLVVNIAERCYEIAEEVKSFKKSAKRLAERIHLLTKAINIANEIDIQSVQERGDYDRFIGALHKLKKCIEEIEAFLKKLKNTSYFVKTFTKGDVKDNFQDFNAILDGLVPALLLILQLEQQKMYTEKLNQLQDCQEAIKDDIENYFQIILAELEEVKKSLPGKSLVPMELKTIKIGDFEDMKLHAKGEYGDLFFATYKPFGEKVAIKKLPESDAVKEKLNKEARLLKDFESPSIVKLWGICTEGSNNLIVFEYMKFGTLRSVLDEQYDKLEYSRRLRMAIDSALGLYHIHHLEMLHRSVTSSKFLVDQYFKVKICDVGLSKTWESALKHSLHPTEKQKKYHAPELLKDPKNKYNCKCEIYCFGIVLWEILTGKIPFEGMSDMDIKRRSFKGEKLDIPKDVGPSGPLISQCMEDEPLSRPSISEIVDKLREILEQHRKTSGLEVADHSV